MRDCHMCNLHLVVGIHSNRVFEDVWGDWELVTAHITKKVMRLIEISTYNCLRNKEMYFYALWTMVSKHIRL